MTPCPERHSLGVFLNEMNRAMGLLNLVQEILAEPIIAELSFIHDLVESVSK